jgi:hypothetical protein
MLVSPPFDPGLLPELALLLLPLAFVRSGKPRVVVDFSDLRKRRERIRCPACAWQPSKADAWCCAPAGCGHVWNTFETRALCPGCSKRWTHTECLRCNVSSPHEAWYEAEEDDE